MPSNEQKEITVHIQNESPILGRKYPLEFVGVAQNVSNLNSLSGVICPFTERDIKYRNGDTSRGWCSAVLYAAINDAFILYGHDGMYSYHHIIATVSRDKKVHLDEKGKELMAVSLETGEFRYNKKTGEIKPSQFLSLLCHFMQIDCPQDVMKAFCNCFSQVTSHLFLYRTKVLIPELCQLVNIRTNSTSCMVKRTLDETNEKFEDVKPFDFVEYNGIRYKNIMAHPFRCYEALDSVWLYLLSEVELHDNATLSEIPFVSRAIVYGNSILRAYGAEHIDTKTYQTVGRRMHNRYANGMPFWVFGYHCDSPTDTTSCLVPYIDSRASCGITEVEKEQRPAHSRPAIMFRLKEDFDEDDYTPEDAIWYVGVKHSDGDSCARKAGG